jgi:hypothetical protein
MNYMRTGTIRAAALHPARLHDGLTHNRSKSPIQTGFCQAPNTTRAGLPITFIAAAMSLAGVLGGAVPSANAAAGDQITIGLVTKTEVNPYFVKLRQAATAEAEKHGAKLIARVRWR